MTSQVQEVWIKNSLTRVNLEHEKYVLQEVVLEEAPLSIER